MVLWSCCGVQTRLSLRWLTIFVCLFGFFKEFKPSEPYLSKYLIEVKDFSDEQVNDQIYPIWTYASLICLLVVAFISEIFSYKHLIVTEGLSQLATRLLLIWGKTLFWIQMTQVTFAWAWSSEVIYYTYLIAIIPHEEYQRTTGYLHSAVLVGHMAAGLVGQGMVSFFDVPLTDLFYFSLASISVANCIAWALPHNKGTASEDESSMGLLEPIAYPTPPEEDGFKQMVMSVLHFPVRIWRALVLNFGWKMSLWTAWWIVGMSVTNLVEGYAPSRFEDVNPAMSYNGIVEAIGRGSSALACLVPAMMESKLQGALGKVITALFSVLSAGACFMLAFSNNIWVCYSGYILFLCFIYFLITFASAEIMKSMETKNFGLIYGMNLFLALVLQTVLQVLILDKVLAITVATKFVVLGGFLVLMFFLFGFISLNEWRRSEGDGGREVGEENDRHHLELQSTLGSNDVDEEVSSNIKNTNNTSDFGSGGDDQTTGESNFS